MRSGTQSKLDDIDAALQAAVQKALKEENASRSQGDELTVDIKRVGTRPAAMGDVNLPLVQRAMAATRSLGVEPALKISSTDSNIPISMGIPAVTMSRGGRSGRSHSLDEWWQDDKGYVSVQIGILTLLAEAGLAE
jgi:di/tripeptidase